jgi:hypothetical protein
MNKISYTYEIISVGERSMEVRYENEEFGVMHVGVRLPYEGEDLATVRDQFSPALYWAEQRKPVQSIQEGLIGTGETTLFNDISDISDFTIETIEDQRTQMVVSRLQAKAVMYQMGILETVEELINESGEIVKLAWNEAIEFKRLSPLVESLKSDVVLPDGSSITDEMLDEMFIEAADINF